VYDHDAPKSENVMDRWILARCQSLIQDVKVEMEGESASTRSITKTDLIIWHFSAQLTACTPSDRDRSSLSAK
jgi:hypothetical protein